MNKRVFAIVALAVVAVLALTACGGGGSAQSITIKGEDIQFAPKDMTVKAGTVTLTFENAGSIEHSFLIDELNVKLEHVKPGTSASVTFEAKAGTYQYYCDVPGHKEAGMVGTLTVTP